mmetsp:Transcript_26898/g.90041  ORF Transcript_26898/g.90041 Transcript_26898/m.90041 type:complete len:260 (-) Transcript_26898:269-1048(-)
MERQGTRSSARYPPVACSVRRHPSQPPRARDVGAPKPPAAGTGTRPRVSREPEGQSGARPRARRSSAVLVEGVHGLLGGPGALTGPRVVRAAREAVQERQGLPGPLRALEAVYDRARAANDDAAVFGGRAVGDGAAGAVGAEELEAGPDVGAVHLALSRNRLLVRARGIGVRGGLAGRVGGEPRLDGPGEVTPRRALDVLRARRVVHVEDRDVRGAEVEERLLGHNKNAGVVVGADGAAARVAARGGAGGHGEGAQARA